MNTIKFETIGTIYSPFTDLTNMPIQPIGAKNVKGRIELAKNYLRGLKDIEEFSHLTLVYYLHEVNSYSLEVTPFLDNKKHGIFATRSPKRPNPIGISVVKLDYVEENIMHISNIDILNKTPLLDIKPYVPQLYEETCKDLKIGWFEEKHHHAENKKSDDRFTD